MKPRELMTYVSSGKQSRVVFFRRRLTWISAKYFILYFKIIHQRGSEWYLANHHRASQSACAKSTCVVYTKYYYFNLFRVMAALQGTQSVDPLCGLYKHVWPQRVWSFSCFGHHQRQWITFRATSVPATTIRFLARSEIGKIFEKNCKPYRRSCLIERWILPEIQSAKLEK